MTLVPMFPKIYSLPGAERAPTVANWQVEIRLSENAANVGWHIVRALVRVREHRIAVRCLTLHECLEIPHYGRVSILTKHQ